jgi:hypothetical protein
MKAKIVGLIAGLLLAVSASAVQAAPISGGFSITGNFLPLDSLGAVTSLDLATGLDFIELLGSTPTPGVPGHFLVNSAQGDFAPLVGQIGAIKDLMTFSAPMFSPVYGFETVGNMAFDLLSVAPVLQTADFLVLAGSGVLHLGADIASGSFKFTGNGANGTFSFSASDGTTAVPEPASMLLMGTGLAVAAFGRRRRASKDMAAA